MTAQILKKMMVCKPGYTMLRLL